MAFHFEDSLYRIQHNTFPRSGRKHIQPSSSIPYTQTYREMPAKGKVARPKGRQTSISDFFKQTPPRPSKRRSTNISPARVLEPIVRVPSPSPPPDLMDIEPPSDPVNELTQEELDVHDQLESLGCSQKRPRGPTPDDTDSTPPRGDRSDAEASDGEDSDCSIQDMERDAALRRSTRITREVVRFGNDVNRPRGTSVFGNSLAKARSSGSEMKRALREFNQKARKEEELEIMRKQVTETTEAGNDECLLKEMADAEERAEEMRREAQEKYSAPIPLFCNKVAMRKMSKKQKRKRSGTFSMHPVHDLIVEALAAGEEDADITLSHIAPVVKGYCKNANVGNLPRLADYLFQLAVFDPTDDKPGRISRDSLVEAIDDILGADLSYFTSSPNVSRLQGVLSVLENFGAVFHDKSDLHQVGNIEPIKGSLDEQAPIAGTDADDENGKGDENLVNSKSRKEDLGPLPVSDEFNRCDRNLGRLFRIAATQVRRGVPLGLVLAEEAVLPAHEYVMLCLGVCTRVLLSAFGNRLYPYIGDLIEASLSLIDEKAWPVFRMKAAEYIHSFTTRLELHVELVTYLLPYKTSRARSLALDIAYLSLQQWCSSNTPSTISIELSERAKEVGTETVSFCLSDVVRFMQRIPDLTTNTDMNWISLVSRLLKVVLSEAAVFEKRLSGELVALKKVLMKMRITTRRLGLDVPVQRMRLALDTVERILQEYANGRERSDIGMVTEEKKQQGSLTGMRASV